MMGVHWGAPAKNFRPTPQELHTMGSEILLHHAKKKNDSSMTTQILKPTSEQSTNTLPHKIKVSSTKSIGGSINIINDRVISNSVFECVHSIKFHGVDAVLQNSIVR